MLIIEMFIFNENSILHTSKFVYNGGVIYKMQFVILEIAKKNKILCSSGGQYE